MTITELQEENRMLLAMLGDADSDLPVPGLTMTEGKILKALMAHEHMSRDAIYAISGSRADDGGKIVDVYICRLRKKIAPLGLTIKNIWGTGYFIPREFKDAFKASRAA